MIFAPASVTAFFSPKLHENPKKAGSLGVGIVLSEGVLANVSNSEGVRLNGEKVDFPTVSYVIERVGVRGVDLRTNLPLSCGFGLSGASALATAFLKGPSDYLEMCDLAHESEVVNRTGLGDVVCQCYGGVVARIKPGAPSVAKVVKFFFNAELNFLVLGKINTAEFLSSYNMSTISKIGEECLREFVKKPTLENLFEQSKKFAFETGIGEELRDVIEAVESSGGRASMVMLGKTVFAICKREVLEEFKGQVFTARIRNCGVDVR